VRRGFEHRECAALSAIRVSLARGRGGAVAALGHTNRLQSGHFQRLRIPDRRDDLFRSVVMGWFGTETLDEADTLAAEAKIIQDTTGNFFRWNNIR
jgi:hypothetical protein